MALIPGAPVGLDTPPPDSNAAQIYHRRSQVRLHRGNPASPRRGKILAGREYMDIIVEGIQNINWRLPGQDGSPLPRWWRMTDLRSSRTS